MTIEELAAKLNAVITANAALEAKVADLTTRMDDAWEAIERKASDGHYHDYYASVDHVERSEQSFNNQLSRLQNDISNLEYRISDVDRKTERAQSTADNASRNGRGYY